MEIAKTYNSAQAEQTWYKYWLDNKFFKSTPDHLVGPAKEESLTNCLYGAAYV